MAIRSGIMLCYPFEERRLLNQGRFSLLWTPPYILHPKLNGERCRMIVENKRCLLLSSSEEIIPSVPHINHSGLLLPPGEYDGELYTHGLSFSEIHSRVSMRTSLHPDYRSIELHLFDIVSSDPQWERLWNLANILREISTISPIKQVIPTPVSSLSEIYALYSVYIDSGYEGFVIRHMDAPYIRTRTPALMKFKPKKTDHYEIVQVLEATSEDGALLGMVGAFECRDPEGTTFKVGAGHLSHDERRTIWISNILAPEHFKSKFLEIEYQTMSDAKGVPLFSRALRIVESPPLCGSED